MDKQWKKNVKKLIQSPWTSEDLKKAFKNELSQKQKNHINNKNNGLQKITQELP